MPWLVLTVAFLLLWAGVTLLIDSRQRPPHRAELANRLRPYRRRDLAEEVEDWLAER